MAPHRVFNIGNSKPISLREYITALEDALGKKPAPGNPGSAFNEIVSGEGIHMLDEDSNMSEQELAQKMFDQFGGSGLGLEQTQASGIPKEAYPPHINEAIDKAFREIECLMGL